MARQEILNLIAANPGLTQDQLVELTGMASYNLSSALSKLTLYGHLERIREPHSKSRYQIRAKAA